jgi:hypothetical protein
MRRIEIICNFCGATKGQVNHWYSLWVGKDGLKELIIGKLDSGPQPYAYEACGQRCVQEAVSRWLATGKLE